MQTIIDNSLILVLVALLIIASLATYAGILLARLKHQKKIQDARHQARRQDILFSVVTIIKATLQQQCGISEATVRVRGLLNALEDPQLEFKRHMPEAERFFLNIEHHPILEARKKLPKDKLRKLDQEREELEAQYESTILTEIEAFLATIETQVSSS